jgi:GR25 family glycosyltransferase involved in LPS biosynthesis
VQNKLYGIDKIFVVSAITSFDRRSLIEEDLINLELDFEFYISGPIPIFNLFHKLLRREYQDKYELQWIQHPNEIAATMAHLNVIQIAKTRKYKNVLIFEDDVLFHNQFVDKFNVAFQNLPEDFNVAYLITNDQTPQDDLIYNEYWKIVKGSSLACAYVINEKFYDNVLNFYSENYAVIDVFYYFNQYLHNYYSLNSPIAVPNPSSVSSITDDIKRFNNIDYSDFSM